MNLSLWERESYYAPTDFLVIGGGIVGLSAAISLKKADPAKRVLLLERGLLPSGASTKNAGFACFGSVSELMEDLNGGMPKDNLVSLMVKRYEGLQYLRGLLSDGGIGYQHCGGYEVFDRIEDYEKALAFIPEVNQWLKIALGLEEVYAPVHDFKKYGFGGCVGMIYNKAEGSIDTGRMMLSLQRLAHQSGVDMLLGEEVKSISDDGITVKVTLANGIVLNAGKVLVCTNGFAQKLLPSLPVTPARNQVLVTEPINGLPLDSCFHYNGGYVYFRNVGDRILLGGFRNLAKEEETTSEFGNTPLIQKALLDFLSNFILPNQKIPKIELWWSGILGVGEEKRPITRLVSPNVGVAVRMGGMGVAIGARVGVDGANLML